MDWKTWLKSMAAAAIGGAATGAANTLTTGQGGQKIAVTAGVGALATVLAYLIRSPLGSVAPAAAVESGSTVASGSTQK
jgi:hypothetical protein